MGRFRIQLLTEDDLWSTQYTIPKNDEYSNTLTEWTLLNLDFTIENYGIKLIYDQIETAHADMCFSNITITHSVYYMNNHNYFKDIFESIHDYKKVVLLIFLFQNDKNLLNEVGFTQRDINRLSIEFKNILLEEFQDYSDHIKSEEESIIERISNK